MIVSEQLLRQIEDLEIEQELQNRASQRLSKIAAEARRLEILLRYIDHHRLKKSGRAADTAYVPSQAQQSETERLETELSNMEVDLSDFQAQSSNQATAERSAANFDVAIPDIPFDTDVFEISPEEDNVADTPAQSTSSPPIPQPVTQPTSEVIANAKLFDVSEDELSELQALPDPRSEKIPDITEALSDKPVLANAELDNTVVDELDEPQTAEKIDADMRARVEQELDEEIYAGADYYERRYLDELKALAEELGIRQAEVDKRVQHAKPSNGASARHHKRGNAQHSESLVEARTLVVDKPAHQAQTGYVVCLMFNKKAPLEWTEEGSGGWRELGFGQCYKEPKQAKNCVQKLQKRWPEYPLKVIKRG